MSESTEPCGKCDGCIDGYGCIGYSTPPTEAEMGLLFPFIVCATNGGPFEDGAFVAGCYFGGIQARIESGTADLIEQYVPSALIPQLDLLAMHHGWRMSHEPWPDHPDDWTWVVLGAPPSGQRIAPPKPDDDGRKDTEP